MNSNGSPASNRIQEANKIKELIVLTMVREGFITKEKADLFLENYAIIQHTKGWLGNFVDRHLKNSSDAMYRVVKLIKPSA